MRQYEITYIIDPVLPGDEVQKAAKAYEKLISDEGCSIVNVDNMGLKQLAYPINRKNSGNYQCIEFQTEDGAVIPKMELAMRRDERIMRFLTVKLDKYGVKYNADKRGGLIGKKTRDKSEDGTPDVRKVVDDLTLIGGVNKKTAQLLNTAGINTYSDLAASSLDKVKDILSKGGPAYLENDPQSWADQAKLAAGGDWTGLNKMKNKLSGVSSEEE